jgi:[ribosomal protein S5]-alanine N-acetyltransferase
MRERAIEGPRVFLALLTHADIDERYLSWFDDGERVKFYSGSGRVFTREAVIAEMDAGAESGSVFVYGIFTRDSELLIGTIKIGPIDHRNQTSDLVAHIGDRENGGKGIASEAISLGNTIAFESLGIRKLFGGMYEANVAAIGAYLRAGWVVEGRRRDHYLVEGHPMDRVLVACFKHPLSDEVSS